MVGCSIRHTSSTVACENFLECWPKGQYLVFSVASNDGSGMRCLGALLHLKQGCFSYRLNWGCCGNWGGLLLRRRRGASSILCRRSSAWNFPESWRPPAAWYDVASDGHLKFQGTLVSFLMTRSG